MMSALPEHYGKYCTAQTRDLKVLFELLNSTASSIESRNLILANCRVLIHISVKK